MTTSKLPEHTAAALTVTVLLPADVTAPAIARHVVRDTLFRLGCEALDDVLLATSELVTNAVEHGDRPERLELDYAEGRVTLRVFDTGETAPELRIPAPARARSRGLQLVSALAEDWGFRRSDGGKYVWARFLLPG